MPRVISFMTLVFLLCTPLPMSQPPASAQSQSGCPDLPTPVERAICRNDDLIQLDRNLNKIYAGIRDRLELDGRLKLAKEQNNWLDERNECGAKTTCLRNRYGERLSFLKRRRSAMAATYTGTPANTTITNTTAATATVPTPMPSTASTNLCPGERAVTSINSRIGTSIRFLNRADSASASYRIYWLDYKGRRQLRATVQRGQSNTRKTYLTHPWLITRLRRDGVEECIQIIMPDPGGRTVTLK